MASAAANTAIVQRLKRMENITVRPSSEDFTARSFDQSRMRTQPAASRRATMPLLALNRKDTGWRIDWQNGPKLPTGQLAA
jgi:hypothetical protein